MMKKLLFSLLFALVLVSCSKDDTLPLPEISKIEITGTPDGKMEVTAGTAVTFSVECKNVDVVRYEWIVNEKTESEKATFEYTPAVRGSYAISVKIYNADGGVSAKEIGTLKVVDPAPVIEALICNDKPVADHAVDLNVGTAAKLAVTVSNVGVASYVWTLNGKTVETATGAELTLPAQDASGDQAVTVSAVNLDGIAVKDSVTVRFNGPYKTGLWVYGSTKEGLSFYNTQAGTFFESNLFETVNSSAIGATYGINDAYIAGNKLFLLIPSTASKRAQITVCDAQTLKQQRVITAEGFNSDALKSSAEIYNLLVVDENKFYITFNASNDGNKSGIGVLKTQEDGNNTFAKIDETYGPVGVDGPCYSHMVKNGNDVWAACGNRIVVIDSKTDQIVRQIPVDADRQVCDIVRGRDGNLYALVAGKIDKSGNPYWMWGTPATSVSSVMKIDPATYTGNLTDILIDGKQADIANGLYGCMACASRTSDELFFLRSGGYSATEICRYDYSTGKSSSFVQLGSTTGLYSMFAKFMATSEDGLLYTPTTNYSDVKVGVFRLSDGQQMTDIQNKIGSTTGDGGVILTDQFAQ